MKILKYLLLLIIVVLIGSAVYISIIDGHFYIEKTIKIRAPKNLVFKQVSELKNWKNWVSLENHKKHLEKSITKNSKGKGAFLTWQEDSLNIHGKLKTTSIIHYSSINQQAFLEKSFCKTDYQIFWTFKNNNDTTSVSLEIKGKHNFWSKALNIINDNTPVEELKPEVEKSLEGLKKGILKRMKVYSIHVDGVGYSKTKDYIFTPRAAKNKPEILEDKRNKALQELGKFMKINHLKKTGPAFMVFNSIDLNHGNVIISIGIPIAEKEISENSDSNILVGTLSKRHIIKSTLKGDYKNIPKLWEATKNYMQKNNLIMDEEMHPYEVFKISNQDSKNPADWVTQLFVPIKKNSNSNDLPPDLGI